MTDTTTGTPAAADAIARLCDQVARLEARLERVEARVEAPAPAARLGGMVDAARSRAGAAWAAMTAAGPDEPGAGATAGQPAGAARRSAVGLMGMIVVALLAAWVAVEIADELFRALRRLLRWLF